MLSGCEAAAASLKHMQRESRIIADATAVADRCTLPALSSIRYYGTRGTAITKCKGLVFGGRARVFLQLSFGTAVD